MVHWKKNQDYGILRPFCAESKRRRGMRTYLVTGGAGFIGSNYIHYMFRKYDNEIRIINVDALTYAAISRT